nr:uncharacterized protein C1orf100 homolog isoform X3 [Columba livia]
MVSRRSCCPGTELQGLSGSAPSSCLLSAPGFLPWKNREPHAVSPGIWHVLSKQTKGFYTSCTSLSTRLSCSPWKGRLWFVSWASSTGPQDVHIQRNSRVTRVNIHQQILNHVLPGHVLVAGCFQLSRPELE